MDPKLKYLCSLLNGIHSFPSDAEYLNALREVIQLLKKIDFNNFEDTSHELVQFALEVINAILASYNKLSNTQKETQKSDFLKAISILQSVFLNETFLEALASFDVPTECFGILLVKFGHLASSADQIDIRLAFQVWKFVSQILALFHVQIKEAFLQDFHCCAESLQSDEFILYMLLTTKRLFGKCMNDTEKCSLAENGEPVWRSKLKLIAFVCRIFVGCVQQFQSVLFMTNEKCQHRRVADFVSWTLEVQYAGGLLVSGSGLEPKFLKEVSTSLFVAAEMALSCVSQVEPEPGLCVSAAANAIVFANLAPLVNCRIFASILGNLCKRKDSRAFSMWLCDDFNAYAEFFINLEASFALWKPYETTPNPADFHIPRFLNLELGKKELSLSVERFLTAITIEVCRSVRHLPSGAFSYLESALLETVLHASPVISIVAQDIWCFVVRYGSAELCWQYVTQLGNAILCLAERYTSSTAVIQVPLPKARAPLEQISRLGCLLSRFLVFLTARQQREFLSTFPLFDSLAGGATEKSLLWRFLILGQVTSQLQLSIRPLLERQILEQASHLLRNRAAAAGVDWLLDTLTCLRLAENLAPTSLAPYAAVLSQLCASTLTFDDSEVDGPGIMVAPPYLLHLTDPSARLQEVLSLLAHWFPRRLLLLASEASPIECQQLLQVLFTQLRTCCRNGLDLPALNAISSWILECIPGGANEATPLSAFSLASLQFPLAALSSSPSPLSPTLSQTLSPLWSPLCQTELTAGCELAREIAQKLKSKLRELCPSVGWDKRARPLGEDENADNAGANAAVDSRLTVLAEIIDQLADSSSTFTSDHRSRGYALALRLSALFPASSQ